MAHNSASDNLARNPDRTTGNGLDLGAFALPEGAIFFIEAKLSLPPSMLSGTLESVCNILALH